jgi:hypothetical protein
VIRVSDAVVEICRHQYTYCLLAVKHTDIVVVKIMDDRQKERRYIMPGRFTPAAAV